MLSSIKRMTEQKRHLTVISANRSNWPPCLKYHGILPLNSTVTRGLHQDIQQFLHDVILEMDSIARITKIEYTTTHKHAGPTYRQLLDAGYNRKYYPSTIKNLFDWQTKLTWCDEGKGEVTDIELALDYEITMGVELPTTYESASIGERARCLRRINRSINKTCEAKRLPPLIPATAALRIHRLRSYGAPAVLGYNRGVKLASQHAVQEIIKNQLTKTSTKPSEWGKTIPNIPKPVKSDPQDPSKQQREQHRKLDVVK